MVFLSCYSLLTLFLDDICCVHRNSVGLARACLLARGHHDELLVWLCHSRRQAEDDIILRVVGLFLGCFGEHVWRRFKRFSIQFWMLLGRFENRFVDDLSRFYVLDRFLTIGLVFHTM